MRTSTAIRAQTGLRRLAPVGAGTLALLLLCGRAPAQPAAGETKTVEGVVKSLTTAPRGEVDGAVLEDGTVIHWPPHLADRFTAILDKGDRVKATGRMETGPEGDTHLEVQSVTNTRTKATRENDAPPPPDRPGRRGGRGARPPDKPAPRVGPVPPDDPAGDLERRLRAVEDRLDRLTRELERRRDR